MTEAIDHEDIELLLGAYVLDATEPVDTAFVEKHLRTCAACRAEVDDLLEVAGMLGTDDVAPPAELWSKITEQLGNEPPVAATTLRAARRVKPTSRYVRLSVAAAIVLLAGIAGLTMILVHQHGQIDRAHRQLASITSSRSLAAQAERAANRFGAKQIALQNTSGVTIATIVIQPDETAYLVPTESMSVLGSRRTYQLWGVAGTQAISLGVLGAKPQVTRLSLPRATSAVAVTEETASGVVTSRNTPVAQAKIS